MSSTDLDSTRQKPCSAVLQINRLSHIYVYEYIYPNKSIQN